jgi:cytochrome c peroxidase
MVDDQNLSDISMKGAPACARCHMLVARFAPQVVASAGTYHRECFEAWYVGRNG